MGYYLQCREWVNCEGLSFQFDMLNKRFDTRMINIRGKKYTVYNLYDMYMSGRLLFPFKPVVKQILRTSAQEAIDILLLSIPFPRIYVSERQDGVFVVLDSSLKLLGLLELLDLAFEYRSAGANCEFDGRYFSEIDRYMPSVTATVMDSKIKVEIIEYYTPLYLHMRTGLATENWTIQQEQAVRNILYEGDGIDCLRWLASNMNIPNIGGRSGEFCVLNILLVEFACHLNWREVASSTIHDEQYLFEETIYTLERLGRKQTKRICDELEEFGIFCGDRFRDTPFNASYGRRHSSQYRNIAYIFQLWKGVCNSQISVSRVESLIHDKELWVTIGKAVHSIGGIRSNMEKLGGPVRC